MTKLIPIKQHILRYDHRPLRIQEHDADGEPMWEVEPVPQQREGKPKLKSADTFDVIELVLRNIPREIQKANDGIRSHALWAAMTAAQEAVGTGEPLAGRPSVADGQGPDGPLAEAEAVVATREQEEATYLRLRDVVYEWFHALLDRKLPLSKEAKDSGIESISLGTQLFGLSLRVVKEQLKDEASQKSLERLAEEDE